MLYNRSTATLCATALCGSLVFLPFVHRDDEPSALDNAGLQSMLDNMGYSPKPLSNGYLISIKQDSWTYNMQLLLSSDGSKIGMNANLGVVEDPSTITSDQWRTLLEKNEDVDPSSFYFDKENKKLYIHRALDNRQVTPAFMRKQIENFCSNIHDTSDEWGFTK